MKREQWQTIINELHHSELSKRAFADKHNLVYSQLLYWIRQLDASDRPKKAKADDLVPVIVKPTLSQIPMVPLLGTIEFPNGTSFKIHSPDLISLLPKLLSA